jgi:hypothetical protein
MVVILVAVFIAQTRDAANQFCVDARIAREAGAGSTELCRSF